MGFFPLSDAQALVLQPTIANAPSAAAVHACIAPYVGRLSFARKETLALVATYATHWDRPLFDAVMSEGLGLHLSHNPAVPIDLLSAWLDELAATLESARIGGDTALALHQALDLAHRVATRQQRLPSGPSVARLARAFGALPSACERLVYREAWPAAYLALVHPETETSLLHALCDSPVLRGSATQVLEYAAEHPHADSAIRLRAVLDLGHAVILRLLRVSPAARRDPVVRVALWADASLSAGQALAEVLSLDDADDDVVAAVLRGMLTVDLPTALPAVARELRRLGVERARVLTATDLTPLIAASDPALREIGLRAVGFASMDSSAGAAAT